MHIAIVTPVLNGAARFRACAASVRAAAQCAMDRGIKVTHFVRESDASTESVEEYARAAGCDFRRGPDAGLYDAIGRGLDDAIAAGADILCWLACDEQLLPQTLSLVADALVQDNDLVFGDYLLLNASGEPVAARREIPARRFYLRHGPNYLLSCATFFRASLWKNSAKFDLTYHLLADKKWYLGVIDRGARVVHLPQYLAAFGVTGNNASLGDAARAEQACLRDEDHAFACPCARRLVRGLRCAEKLFRGCYGTSLVTTTLFTSDATPRAINARLGTRWKW